MSARDILIRFLGDGGGLKKATDDADASTTKLGGNLTKLAGTVATAYVTTQIVAFGKASVEAALADEAAQKTLATTLKNVTGATDAQIAAAEDYILKLAMQTGVADDELRPALDRLVRATGDVGEAQGLLSLAMDVSAGTGKELSAVAEALGKAQDGNTGALKRLGVATTDANGNALTFEQTVASLADTFKGQAAAAADTNAGKLAKMKVAYGELQETIGAALLPILGELVGVASTLIGWFSSLDEGTQEWIARILILGGSLLGSVVTINKVIGIFKSFGSTMDLAKVAVEKFGMSIGQASLAMGAIGLVIAAGVFLYQGYAASQKRAEERTRSFVDAMKEEEAGHKDAVNALIAKNLVESGAIESGTKLGLSASQMAAVIRGEEVPAWEEVNVVRDEYSRGAGAFTADVDKLRTEFEKNSVALTTAAQKYKDMTEAEKLAKQITGELTTAEGALTTQTNTTKDATEQLSNRFYTGAAVADAAAAATGRLLAAELAAEAATRAWDQAWLALTGNLDAEQAMINLAQQIDDVKVAGDAAWLAQQEATAAYAAGAEDAGVKAQAAEDAQRSYQSALIGTKQSVIDIGKEIGLLPHQVQTLIDLQDNGEIAEMEKRLTILARNRSMQLSITAKGGSGVFTVSGIGAEGGIVTQPTRSIIGDNGPEMVIPLDRMPGASSLPSNIGGGGGFTFINHAPIMAKQDVARELYDLIVDGQRRGELVGSLA